jgi:lipopolysaccharide transport system ATP-binding protein
MSDIVLKIEDVSKQYRLGEVGTGTISHDLNRWWHKVRGKEDPFLIIGETNDRTQKGDSEYAWALRDINFEVKQGEILGIIGKNGAGKSTLLKILSKVTGPTQGSIKSRGRIASLLEVGTGFHPELTGRENVYLNGAIMGMTKREVSAKLDEIVDFAGVERYLDTPVKRYSSGMMVRLGFSVAAHLEPEILIIDEVLAVGDADFQKKCIGKIGDVAQGGRTVLFVSHNMASITNLCSRAILLNNGRLVEDGSVESVMNSYISKSKNEHRGKALNGLQLSWQFVNCSNELFVSGDKFEIDLEIIGEVDFGNITIVLTINSAAGDRVVNLSSRLAKFNLPNFSQVLKTRVSVNNLAIMPNNYNLSCTLFSEVNALASWENFDDLRVIEDKFLSGLSLPSASDRGYLNAQMKWQVLSSK